MISLDMQSRIPIYEQIANGISRLCLTGVLMSDEKLPSVRSLAIELGINPNTVQKAYQQLERNGLIYSVEGRGSFVRPMNQISMEKYVDLTNSLTQAVAAARDSGMTLDQIMSVVNEIYSQRSSEL